MNECKPLEAGTVALFQRSTRSVVNVVDLTVLSGKPVQVDAVSKGSKPVLKVPMVSALKTTIS